MNKIPSFSSYRKELIKLKIWIWLLITEMMPLVELDLRASEFDLIMIENEIEPALFVVTFIVVDLTMKRFNVHEKLAKTRM